MSYALAERVAALYLPMMAAVVLGLVQGRREGRFPAGLLGWLWAMCSLLVLQRLNLHAGWWRFAGDGPKLCGMPLELWAGWAVLWGMLPQMVLPKMRLIGVVGIAASVDLLTMPLLSGVVRLGGLWMLGEAAALLLVLLPAVCLGRWTEETVHLRRRVWLQVILAGTLFLFVLPETAFALRPGQGWGPLLAMSGWERQIILQAIVLLTVPGVSAVMEFAERGGGTPIPYDPPRRLVTSGVYRYVANPMQMSCAMVMAGWAGVLRNGWLLGAALASVIYSAGIAEWDEGQDLQTRFGAAWSEYRAEVRNWCPRWRPYHAGPAARLYLASTCGPCSEVYRWLAARRPVGLEMLAAETLAQGTTQRMRYEAGDGSGRVDGVRAMARALEHLNAGWALAGAALRLPGVWQTVQVMMDASGLGSRVVPHRPEARLE